MKIKKNKFIASGILLIIYYIITYFVFANIIERYSISFPKIDPGNVYWLYSSVMQLNGAIIGLFFVSLSIAISKNNSFIDFFGGVITIFLFANTGLFIIITILCCLGMFFPNLLFFQRYILSLETSCLLNLFIIILCIGYKYFIND